MGSVPVWTVFRIAATSAKATPTSTSKPTMPTRIGSHHARPLEGGGAVQAPVRSSSGPAAAPRTGHATCGGIGGRAAVGIRRLRSNELRGGSSGLSNGLGRVPHRPAAAAHLGRVRIAGSAPWVASGSDDWSRPGRGRIRRRPGRDLGRVRILGARDLGRVARRTGATSVASASDAGGSARRVSSASASRARSFGVGAVHRCRRRAPGGVG